MASLSRTPTLMPAAFFIAFVARCLASLARLPTPHLPMSTALILLSPRGARSTVSIFWLILHFYSSLTPPFHRTGQVRVFCRGLRPLMYNKNISVTCTSESTLYAQVLLLFNIMLLVVLYGTFSYFSCLDL